MQKFCSLPWHTSPCPLPGGADVSHAGAAAGSWGRCRAARMQVWGDRPGGAVRCTRGEGGFPSGGFLPASAGQIVMVSKPFPGTMPQGPAVRILPGMRLCSACFASRRDGLSSSISLPVCDLGTPNPPDLSRLLPRMHPAPPAAGLLISEQRITSARFSFHLRRSCSCAGLMLTACLQGALLTSSSGSAFPPPPFIFFHEEGGDYLQL